MVWLKAAAPGCQSVVIVEIARSPLMLRQRFVNADCENMTKLELWPILQQVFPYFRALQVTFRALQVTYFRSLQAIGRVASKAVSMRGCGPTKHHS